MVDVGHKEETERVAIAKGSVKMAPETLTHIADKNMKKGDVLSVAQLAGIMGAKHTASLIPLCHPLLSAMLMYSLQLTMNPMPLILPQNAR